MCVLVVEDNPINQRFARVLLERGGAQVEVAPDGVAALERLGQRGFDLILMDVQMPRMDGYEATRRLRIAEAAAGLPGTPVIALTANAMAEDRQLCLDAGMDDFLPKPFTREELFAAIARTMGHQEPDPQPAISAPKGQTRPGWG